MSIPCPQMIPRSRHQTSILPKSIDIENYDALAQSFLRSTKMCTFTAEYMYCPCPWVSVGKCIFAHRYPDQVVHLRVPNDGELGQTTVMVRHRYGDEREHRLTLSSTCPHTKEGPDMHTKALDCPRRRIEYGPVQDGDYLKISDMACSTCLGRCPRREVVVHQ